MSQLSPQGEVRFNIGEVLNALRDDFPGVSIPKIRFLEDKGLIKPERTQAGYRKFSLGDVHRLRYILRMQRDHYLPLKVIGEHLEAIDSGQAPPPLEPLKPAPSTPDLGLDGLPSATTFQQRSAGRMSKAELVKVAESDFSFVDELERFALIAAQRGTGLYTEDDLNVVKVAQALASHGIEARHLRGFRAAADREVGLIEQVTSHLVASREIAAKARAEEATQELAALCVRLHAILVKSALR